MKKTYPLVDRTTQEQVSTGVGEQAKSHPTELEILESRSAFTKRSSAGLAGAEGSRARRSPSRMGLKGR